MAHYSLPYHAQMPEQQYLMASHYHDNRMTSLPELGGWMEQGEGGGKFQLKRRRRCGQCGPCQVKDNCNKCQYCLRKDILKQACVLRKCVYLRKPQSHARPEITNGGSKPEGGERGKEVGNGGGGGGRSSSCSSSTNQDSPHKPSASTPSSLPTPTPTAPHPAPMAPHPAPKPVPVNPSAVAAAAAAVHSAELSSCQVAKASAFPMPVPKTVGDPASRSSGLPLNSGGDPLRSVPVNDAMGAGNAMRAGSFPVNKGVGVGDPLHSMPVNKGGVGDPLQSMPMNKGMVEAVRTNGLPANKAAAGCDPLRSMGQHHSAMLNAAAAGALDSCRMSYMSGMDSVRGPQVLGPGTSATNGAAFGMGNALPTSPACAMAKDFPLPQREQYPAPADQWGSVPYGYSHPNPWGPPPVSYGIPSAGSYYPGSTCQLGMTSPANHFAAPSSQPSFHRAVPFAHPEFSSHANFHTSAVQSSMTSPYYPAPVQIPNTLPNFPSFSQLPPSAGAQGSYPAARPPVYPGSFYSSFRPSYEPQIYHVQASPPPCPFARPHRPLPETSSSSSSSSSSLLSSSSSPAGDGLSGFSGLSGSSGRGVESAKCESDKESESGKLQSNRLHEDSRSKGEESVQEPFSVSSVCLKKRKRDRNTSASHTWTAKPAGRKFIGKDHVTDSASMTKADCGKKHVADRDTNIAIDDDLWQVLKRLAGGRHSGTESCDGLGVLTSLRSDECCDSDTLQKMETFPKVKSCSSLVDDHKRLLKCCWKRQHCTKKVDVCVKTLCSSGHMLGQDFSKDTSHGETSWDTSHIYTSKNTSQENRTGDITHEDTSKSISFNNVSGKWSHGTVDRSHDILHKDSLHKIISHKVTSGYLPGEVTLKNASLDTSCKDNLQVMDMDCLSHTPNSCERGNSHTVSGKLVVFSPMEQKELIASKLSYGDNDRESDTDVVCVQTEESELERHDITSPFSPNIISCSTLDQTAGSEWGVHNEGDMSDSDQELDADGAS